MNKLYSIALCLLLVCGSAIAGKGIETLETPRTVSDFLLPGLDGKQHKLADYRGKYVLVNFWAVWCSPCRKEMPSLQRAYELLKGEQFELLAIHAGPSIETAQNYASELKLTFPILVDNELALTSWAIKGLPSTYLIDPEGEIIAEAIGEREWDDVAMLAAIKGQMKK